MRRRWVVIAAALLSLVGAPAAPARADDAHPIPESIRLAHQSTLEYLGKLAARKDRVGEEARRLQPLFQAHMAKEEEFILPPLTLLPALERGEATPDMAWAIPLSDRVRAEQDDIYRSHTTVVAVLTALDFEAESAGENDIRDWVHGAIIDDLNDLEISEPASVMVGEVLRARLGQK